MEEAGLDLADLGVRDGSSEEWSEESEVWECWGGADPPERADDFEAALEWVASDQGLTFWTRARTALRLQFLWRRKKKARLAKEITAAVRIQSAFRRRQPRLKQGRGGEVMQAQPAAPAADAAPEPPPAPPEPAPAGPGRVGAPPAAAGPARAPPGGGGPPPPASVARASQARPAADRPGPPPLRAAGPPGATGAAPAAAPESPEQQEALFRSVRRWLLSPEREMRFRAAVAALPAQDAAGSVLAAAAGARAPAGLHRSPGDCAAGFVEDVARLWQQEGGTVLDGLRGRLGARDGSPAAAPSLDDELMVKLSFTLASSLGTEAREACGPAAPLAALCAFLYTRQDADVDRMLLAPDCLRGRVAAGRRAAPPPPRGASCLARGRGAAAAAWEAAHAGEGGAGALRGWAKWVCLFGALCRPLARRRAVACALALSAGAARALEGAGSGERLFWPAPELGTEPDALTAPADAVIFVVSEVSEGMELPQFRQRPEAPSVVMLPPFSVLRLQGAERDSVGTLRVRCAYAGSLMPGELRELSLRDLQQAWQRLWGAVSDAVQVMRGGRLAESGLLRLRSDQRDALKRAVDFFRVLCGPHGRVIEASAFREACRSEAERALLTKYGACWCCASRHFKAGQHDLTLETFLRLCFPSAKQMEPGLMLRWARHQIWQACVPPGAAELGPEARALALGEADAPRTRPSTRLPPQRSAPRSPPPPQPPPRPSPLAAAALFDAPPRRPRSPPPPRVPLPAGGQRADAPREGRAGRAGAAAIAGPAGAPPRSPGAPRAGPRPAAAAAGRGAQPRQAARSPRRSAGRAPAGEKAAPPAA